MLIQPLERAPHAVVEVPGSKSITNRALVVAGLASGTSRLSNVLVADDTEAMAEGLQVLGATVELDRLGRTATVTGTNGTVRPGPLTLDVRQAGTVSRFLPFVAAAGRGVYRFEAHPAMRARPMAPVIDALRALGVFVEEEQAGHLPFTMVVEEVAGGRELAVAGDVSSQHVSGLLLAAPLLAGGLRIAVTTELVSRPYVDMTIDVMEAFGAAAVREAPGRLVVPPGSYRAEHLHVEPDASGASYFFAAAAITGGRVTVPGLGRSSHQGDLGFVDVLATMGARVSVDDDATTVEGTGVLHGVDVDLRDLSDTAPTLAAVAAFADSPTRIRGIGFIRGKETDRVGNVVAELRRCGIEAVEEPDGLLLRPGRPAPAVVCTYGDHRMAMSFALFGLAVPGIEIDDPWCVAKTFPTYWDALDSLRGG